jgi:hypothetical protein
MHNTNKLLGIWMGKEKEHRKSYRRKMIIKLLRTVNEVVCNG